MTFDLWQGLPELPEDQLTEQEILDACKKARKEVAKRYLVPGCNCPDCEDYK